MVRRCSRRLKRRREDGMDIVVGDGKWRKKGDGKRGGEGWRRRWYMNGERILEANVEIDGRL